MSAGPLRDAAQIGVGAGDMQTASHNVVSAVIVEITACYGHEVCGLFRNFPDRKLLPTVVFEPDDAGVPWLMPVIKQADEDDVLVSVRVQIAGCRRVGTPESSDSVGDEFPVPDVFQPDAAMIRLWIGIVVFEVVPQRPDKIRISVPVEVTRLNVRDTPHIVEQHVREKLIANLF